MPSAKPAVSDTIPQTLLGAVRYFSDPDACFNFLVGLRWKDGVACPHCEANGITCKDVSSHSGPRKLWRCRGCRKQFSVKVGTIFEDSPLGLDKWFMTYWLLANAKNGVSSCEVARAVGVTQKSAWFMLHRIRFTLRPETLEKFRGIVEADETYIGGKEKNKHKDKKLNRGRGAVGKTPVMGLLERAGEGEASQVRAAVVPDNASRSLHGEVRAHVEAGSALFTDAWRGYNGLAPEYRRQFVDHAVKYVMGQVHTNGLENFWTLLKRTIKGTYTFTSVQHLAAYLDEQAYRFNSRGDNDGGRFVETVGFVAGKRLTYEELTHGHLTLYGGESENGGERE